MTENPAPPAATDGDPPTVTAPPGTLLVADVARILSEERRKKKVGAPDIKPSTVWANLKESRPMVGTEPGRYAGNPFPAPDGYTGANKKGPWWKVEREQEIRDWSTGRPGYAHGTGGRRAGSKRTPD